MVLFSRSMSPRIPVWILELFIGSTVFALVCHFWRSQNKSVSGTWMWLRSRPQCWAPGARQMTSIQRRKRQEEGLGKATPIQFWSHNSIQGLFDDLTVEDRSTCILWEWKQGKEMLVLEDCIFTEKRNNRELNYGREDECKMLEESMILFIVYMLNNFWQKVRHPMSVQADKRLALLLCIVCLWRTRRVQILHF